MAQYRARSKAGWAASATSGSEKAGGDAAEDGSGGGVADSLSLEEKQLLADREEANKVGVVGCVSTPRRL